MDEHRQRRYRPSLRMNRPRRSVFSLILGVYSLVGLAVAVVAGGYIIASSIRVSLTPTEMIALIAGGGGLILAASSWLYSSLLKRRASDRTERLGEYARVLDFLDSWNRFEELARYMTETIGDRPSPSALIMRIYEESWIELGDADALMEIMQARNSVVHEGWLVTKDFSTAAIAILRKVSEKLTAIADKRD